MSLMWQLFIGLYEILIVMSPLHAVHLYKKLVTVSWCNTADAENVAVVHEKAVCILWHVEGSYSGKEAVDGKGYSP